MEKTRKVPGVCGYPLGVKRALLCICPPYPMIGPPAGAAALLGYLKAHGIRDFGFLDLRLATPSCYEATYTATGVFGESFVLDVPDLPIVLQLLAASDEGQRWEFKIDERIEQYCFERGLSPSYLASYLNGLNRYYEIALEHYKDVDFFGFSVWTSNLLPTLLAAHHLKRRAKPPVIVAGGPQLTESPASAALALRSRLFDAVVQGEGEETLRELYAAFDSGGRVRVQGIGGTQILDSNSNQVVTMPRPLLKIDSLPPPSFDEMAIDAYQTDDDRTLPYQLSRGCTDKCTFCSEWVFWQKFRPSDGTGAAGGVAHLRSHYGATYIAFTDSLLNGNRRRLQEFSEALLSQRLNMKWGGFMRADMDDDLAQLIHRAGCREAFIGVESFDDSTLEAMNKRRTEADNVHALRAFLKAGIFVVAGLIPGFPGDSRRGFMHSVSALRRLQAEFPGRLRVNTEVFRVSPGLPLYSDLEAAGLQPKKWADSYLDIAPQYSDITSGIFCSVEGSNQGIERIGRERIAFMIRTDEPVRTDKFDYDEDEHLAIGEFESQHVFAGWHLARTKLASAFIYALLVDEDELAELQDLARTPSLAAYLRELEGRHIHFPSRDRPPIPEVGFHRDLPREGVVELSPLVVIRAAGKRHNARILTANYVNGRIVLRPGSEGPLLQSLATSPMRIPSSTPRIQRSLEALHKAAILASRLE